MRCFLSRVLSVPVPSQPCGRCRVRRIAPGVGRERLVSSRYGSRHAARAKTGLLATTSQSCWLRSRLAGRRSSRQRKRLKNLNLLEETPEIAVIITDQRMPTMSGAEFLARVGDKSKALRILVTGYSDLSDVIRSVNEGRIFGYATKPWDPHDLRSKVDKAAEHFRLGQQLARERELLRSNRNSECRPRKCG